MKPSLRDALVAVLLAAAVAAATVVSAYAKSSSSSAAPLTVSAGCANPSPSTPSSPTNTPTNTPTSTPMATPTNTPTDTPTATPTNTPTNTPTDTPTATPTNTPTNTPTDTPTATPTDTPTNTPTPDITPVPTITPTPMPGGLRVLPSTLVATQPATPSTTGNGTIGCLDGTTASFSFNAQAKNGSVKGSLRYSDPASGKTIVSTSVTTLNVVGTTATFGGSCGGSCTFTATVTDGGEPPNDTFAIMSGSYSAGPSHLASGNIQVRSR
jgi:hypothetical protein